MKNVGRTSLRNGSAAARVCPWTARAGRFAEKVGKSQQIAWLLKRSVAPDLRVG